MLRMYKHSLVVGELMLLHHTARLSIASAMDDVSDARESSSTVAEVDSYTTSEEREAKCSTLAT